MYRLFMWMLLVSAAVVPSMLHAGQPDRHNKAIGVLGGGGLSFVTGHGWEEILSVHRQEYLPKFSGTINGYFDYRFKQRAAIQIGLGMVSKGLRFDVSDASHHVRLQYMELPLMAKFYMSSIRLAAGIALSMVISGKEILKDYGTTQTTKWGEKDLQYLHRFNVGLAASAGYEIAAGPVFILPMVSFRMHLLNEIDTHEVLDKYSIVQEDNLRMRFINLHLACAVEYAF